MRLCSYTAPRRGSRFLYILFHHVGGISWTADLPDHNSALLKAQSLHTLYGSHDQSICDIGGVQTLKAECLMYILALLSAMRLLICLVLGCSTRSSGEWRFWISMKVAKSGSIDVLSPTKHSSNGELCPLCC